jgi:hypothetical protein
MWANGLRCVEEGGVTVAELRSASRAACNLAGLERWGWITVGGASAASSASGSGPGGRSEGTRRAGFGSSRGIGDETTVRPTAAGSFARQAWPGILERVEQRWEERFGVDTLDRLRAALGESGTRLPWSLPEVHASDGFSTHVHDGGPDVVSGEEKESRAGRVPLAALIARTLTRLTLDHEAAAGASLPLAANGLRVIGDTPVPIRELPSLSGVSKEAVEMLTGYLGRKGLGETGPGPGRTIALTAAGTAARLDYERRAVRPSGGDLDVVLRELLGRSDEVAAGLVPPEGNWRGEAPYLKQTQRILADPTGALPWHPMVLHRGGWPDGS